MFAHFPKIMTYRNMGDDSILSRLYKRKYMIILTLSTVLCYFVYQLCLFFAISEPSGNRFTPVVDHSELKDMKHLRSEADRYINDNGVIRGVFYPYMKKYRPDSTNLFKCLNSEQKIPYDLINDDYCDCEDGTDEPSTNACPNGTFYCDFQLLKPVALHQVPSGKVNDGICDCCDGSDEFIHTNTKLLSQSSSKHYRHYVTKCANLCQ